MMQKSENIVRYTAEEIDEMLAHGEDQTDWERVRALTHEEIEASIDFEDEGEFSEGEVFAGPPPLPPPKEQLTLRIDQDIVNWFKDTGKGYQTRINTVLRRYVEAQKRA